MKAVDYWVAKARRANTRCIWPRFPADVQASRELRRKYMAAARIAKNTPPQSAGAC